MDGALDGEVESCALSHLFSNRNTCSSYIWALRASVLCHLEPLLCSYVPLLCPKRGARNGPWARILPPCTWAPSL